MKNKKQLEHTKTKTARIPSVKPAETATLDKPFVPLTRKNVLELRISSLDEDGYGTARSEEGMTLRVGGALPGDVVLAGIDHVAGGTAFCHVKKLLQPSQLRSNNPPCRESADCFGCPLIAMK
ncbi:MAG TPA: 23S rRNA (uracil-5-)-methyltransferase RumA, partial [Desulfuromonadaceae bacterium]